MIWENTDENCLWVVTGCGYDVVLHKGKTTAMKAVARMRWLGFQKERKKKNRTIVKAARVFKRKRDPQERELVIPCEN